MKHIITFFLILLLFPLSATADQGQTSNDLLDAVVPFEYGIERFEERIAASSGEDQPIGLLLSGGSARAFAHIGVIRAFEEMGISPDYIVSNSMGSIVGILYAAGLNSDQIYEIVKNIDPGTLFNMTYPFDGGLLDPSAFVDFVSAYVAGTPNIEDLQIPIIVITEDAKTKRQVLAAEGEISKILAAAFALPVYFPPVEFREHLLLDGGTTNLVPVEIATRFSDRVIVSTTFYEGKGINLKNPLSLLNVSMDAAKRRLGVKSLLDNPEAVWIRCDVEDFSFMDFDKVDELSANGYSSAMAVSDQLLPFISSSQTQETSEVQSTFAETHKKALDNYSYFRIPAVSGTSHQIFTGAMNFPEGERSYLRSEVLAGLRYTFTAPSVSLTTVAGGAWEPYGGNDFYPEIILQGRYLPLPFLQLKGTYGAAMDALDSWSQYVSAEILVHQLAFSRSLVIEEKASIEGNIDDTLSFTELLVDGGLGFSYSDGWSMNGSVSYQLWDEFSRQFVSGSAGAMIPLTADVTLRPSATLRYAIDGNGDVPFFTRDGYYTSASVLLEQGRGGAANASNHIGVFSLEADWNPHTFRPTMGEMLIFKNSAIGAFAQLLWMDAGEYVPQVSGGVQVKTNLGFIGLMELPMRLFVSYDTLSEGIIGGFSIAGGLK